VRTNLNNGADFIKILATGAVLSKGIPPGSQQYSDAEIQAAVTEARVEVPEPQLRIYDRLAVKPGHPVCVPVKSGKCGGCHLKVPTHIEVMAKSGAEIATCDQCGRILYWQP